MQRVYDFLKACQTYYLATCDGDQPRVRPFGTIDIFDGKLCIQTGKSKPTSRQIHTNPNIEICAFDGRQKWLRLKAQALEEPRVEAQKQMLDAYPELQSMYAPGDGETEIFKLENVVATFASFAEAPVTYEF